MAKEDFCFTYYDGDAARDKAHMNRLERGAYDDIISAQRKKGHLSLDDVKRVLSKDFLACWDALIWVLKQDENENFYIEWVDRSIKRALTHSEKQRENIKKRWGKKEEQIDTMVIPPYEFGNTKGHTKTIPLEDGYGDKEDDKGGVGEKEETEALIPIMLTAFCSKNTTYKKSQDRDFPELLKIVKFLNDDKLPNDTDAFIKIWEGIVDFIATHSFYRDYSLKQVNTHIQSILQAKINGTSKKPISKSSTAFNGRNGGFQILADTLKENLATGGAAYNDDEI